MQRRREFLKHLAGIAATTCFPGGALRLLGAPLPQTSEKSQRRQVLLKGRRVKTVDMHTHTTVPGVSELLKGTPLERQAGGNAMLLDAGRITKMDRDGID